MHFHPEIALYRGGIVHFHPEIALYRGGIVHFHPEIALYRGGIVHFHPETALYRGGECAACVRSAHVCMASLLFRFFLANQLVG